MSRDHTGHVTNHPVGKQLTAVITRPAQHRKDTCPWRVGGGGPVLFDQRQYKLVNPLIDCDKPAPHPYRPQPPQRIARRCLGGQGEGEQFFEGLSQSLNVSGVVHSEYDSDYHVQCQLPCGREHPHRAPLRPRVHGLAGDRLDDRRVTQAAGISSERCPEGRGPWSR